MRSPLSLPLALLLAALTACSDDASPGPDEAPACSSLQATGPFISEPAVASLPAPQGGSLSNGAYALTAMQGSGQATPRRDAMILTSTDANGLQVEWTTEQEGGAVVVRRGSVAVTSATELTFQWACPDIQSEGPAGFTADATTLTLFGALGTLTFERQ